MRQVFRNRQNIKSNFPSLNLLLPLNMKIFEISIEIQWIRKCPAANGNCKGRRGSQIAFETSLPFRLWEFSRTIFISRELGSFRYLGGSGVTERNLSEEVAGSVAFHPGEHNIVGRTFPGEQVRPRKLSNVLTSFAQ